MNLSQNLSSKLFSGLGLDRYDKHVVFFKKKGEL